MHACKGTLQVLIADIIRVAPLTSTDECCNTSAAATSLIPLVRSLIGNTLDGCEWCDEISQTCRHVRKGPGDQEFWARSSGDGSLWCCPAQQVRLPLCACSQRPQFAAQDCPDCRLCACFWCCTYGLYSCPPHLPHQSTIAEDLTAARNRQKFVMRTLGKHGLHNGTTQQKHCANLGVHQGQLNSHAGRLT